MSVCRSCGAQVLWVPTGKTKPDGKPVLQILDAKSEQRVVLVLVHRDDPLVLADQAAIDADLAVARVVHTYTDHHATCPRAADWRRK